MGAAAVGQLPAVCRSAHNRAEATQLPSAHTIGAASGQEVAGGASHAARSAAATQLSVRLHSTVDESGHCCTGRHSDGRSTHVESAHRNGFNALQTTMDLHVSAAA